MSNGNKRRFSTGQLALLEQLKRLVAKGYEFGHSGRNQGNRETWWAEVPRLGSGGTTVPLEQKSMERLEVAGCLRRKSIDYPLHRYTLHPSYINDLPTGQTSVRAD